jgi:hypothetical protein
MSLIEKDHSSKPLANPKREVCLEFARRPLFKQTYQEKTLDISMLLDSERGFACLLQGVVVPCVFWSKIGGRKGGPEAFKQTSPLLKPLQESHPCGHRISSKMMPRTMDCLSVFFPIYEAKLTGFLTCLVNAGICIYLNLMSYK